MSDLQDAIKPDSVRGSRLQVLVVDDATVVRLYYHQILEAPGYNVDEAMNGLEGLEKALETRFDLAVVDVNMPVMDGLTFIQALRSNPLISSLPVLMTTTQARAVDRQAALQAGANGYLIKPLAATDLTLHAAAMLGDVP